MGEEFWRVGKKSCQKDASTKQPILFGETISKFRRHKISQLHIDLILNTSLFLTGSEDIVPET
jgi:hypothetical protein